jgi:hypothetical protein
MLRRCSGLVLAGVWARDDGLVAYREHDCKRSSLRVRENRNFDRINFTETSIHNVVCGSSEHDLL